MANNTDSPLRINAEIASIHLERLGRKVIEARVYARRDAERKRRILRCVFDHINASDRELKERLDAIMNEDYGQGIMEEVAAEIAKLR